MDMSKIAKIGGLLVLFYLYGFSVFLPDSKRIVSVWDKKKQGEVRPACLSLPGFLFSFQSCSFGFHSKKMNCFSLCMGLVLEELCRR